jgi:hypothetical protein
MSDRALHDTIITALADARFRASPGWIDQHLADRDGVERFSRFLARHFYYDRVVHFFKYSRAMARATGRRPEDVVRGESFEEILPTVVLGSRETASQVARLVVKDQLHGDHAAVPYFEDLLRYQEAMMVVEAGPREWNGAAEQSAPPDQALAQIVEGTIVLELDHDLPAVLPSLLAPWQEPPTAPRQPTWLVVARSPQARVSVVRGNAALVRVLREVDRPRSMRELADRLRLEPSAIEGLLRDLAEMGALRFSIGS